MTKETALEILYRYHWNSDYVFPNACFTEIEFCKNYPAVKKDYERWINELHEFANALQEIIGE